MNTPPRLFVSVLGALALLVAAGPVQAEQLSPDAALDKLMKGNQRFADGVVKARDLTAERKELKTGQAPFACLLACADSRVAPEILFDTGLGELFVVRVAGNVVDNDGIASMEYAVAVLGSPLIVVYGHSACGAVDAAIKVVQKKVQLPGLLPKLVEQIRPAVLEAKQRSEENLLLDATEDNAKWTAQQLLSRSEILSDAVAAGKLKIVSGYYNFATGKVELLK